MPRRTLEERLQYFIEPEPNTGCWIWWASPDGSGYGQLMIAGKMHKVHRLMYERHRGPIPEGYTLDHLCRVRCCVNPAHLEPVTKKENIHRGIGIAARNAKKTHCPRGHPFSGENLFITVTGSRWCRTCMRDASRRQSKHRNRNHIRRHT